MLKVNNRDIRQRQRSLSNVFTIDVEHISLLSSISIGDFKMVNIFCDGIINRLIVVGKDSLNLHLLLWDKAFYSGFLSNELRVTSYELGVIIYCTSYELFFTYELRVIFYIRVTSYYLLHELRINFYIRITSYYLWHELPVKIIRVKSYIYCTSWDCDIDYVKFLYYTSCSSL